MDVAETFGRGFDGRPGPKVRNILHVVSVFIKRSLLARIRGIWVYVYKNTGLWLLGSMEHNNSLSDDNENMKSNIVRLLELTITYKLTYSIITNLSYFIT